MITLVAGALAGEAAGDGVLLDRGAGVLLVAAPGGGIDAVGLADGALRWHAAGADVPLAVDGGLVAGWVDTPEPVLRIVAVDARTGEVVRRCADLALPEGIPGGVDDHFAAHTEVGACEAARTWTVVPALDGGAVAVVDPSTARTRAVSEVRDGRAIPFGLGTDEPLHAFLVVGDVLLSARGNEVAGFGRDGSGRWSRPVRDRSYRGPIPP
jgi:hypothetical protein